MALVPEASIDSHVIYSAQIMHAHAQIMHHVCAGCSQLSNKKIRLEIRSGILEIIAIMFQMLCNQKGLPCMLDGVAWGWNTQDRD